VTFQREEAEDAPNAAIAFSSLRAFALTILREPRPETSIRSDFPTSGTASSARATTHGCQLVRRHWRPAGRCARGTIRSVDRERSLGQRGNVLRRDAAVLRRTRQGDRDAFLLDETALRMILPAAQRGALTCSGDVLQQLGEFVGDNGEVQRPLRMASSSSVARSEERMVTHALVGRRLAAWRSGMESPASARAA
jgi:hypothetical protein